MKKLLITLCALLFIAQNTFSQQFRYTIHIADSTNGLPTTITDSSGYKLLDFADQNIENIFDQYLVTKFEKLYPSYELSSLQHYYTIVCDDSLGNLPNSLKLYDSTIYSMWRYEYEAILLIQSAQYLVPNDYTSSVQTNLDLINMEDAWDIETGSSSITIGVVDKQWGGASTHPELTGKYTFNDPNSPPGGGHGTLVAQIAAANTNNSFGIAGVCHDCPILASPTFTANTGDSYDAMMKLAQSGAKVINISMITNRCDANNNGYPRQDEQDCINKITEMGVLVVASAGNGPATGNAVGRTCHIENEDMYPASYDNVLSVTSLGHLNPQVGTSTYNIKDVILQDLVNPDINYTHTRNTKVDVAAPGYRIPVMEPVADYDKTTPTGTIDLTHATGTSFASPQVAGLAGLIFSHNPCFTPAEVTEIIKSTTVNIDNVQCTINGINYTPNQAYVGTYGTGRVDADAALQMADDLTDPGRTLTANETWNTTRYIQGDIIIPSGLSLTISATTIKFSPGVKVIVNPGGLLNVINSTLIADCNSGLWGGIRAIGVYNGTQDFLTQSRVILNNSIIEDAERGIITGDGVNHLTNGGIVWATGSTFKNCKYGIGFLVNCDYTSKIPSSSYVVGCHFICDGVLKDGSNKGTINFVSMQGVYDIRFEGNTFTNSVPNGILIDQFRGNGLLCIDCSVIVDRGVVTIPGQQNPPSPCDVSTITKTIFTGLTRGIQVLHNWGHTDPSLRVKAIECEFINCETGIELTTDIGTVTYENSFLWDGDFTTVTPWGHALNGTFGLNKTVVGICHDESESFLDEGNSFTYESDFSETYGTSAILENSGNNPANGVANYFRNTSTNIANPTFPGRTIIGNLVRLDNQNLNLRCNDYCDNSYDWYLQNNPNNIPVELFSPTHSNIPNKFSFHDISNPGSIIYNIYADFNQIIGFHAGCINSTAYTPTNCPIPYTFWVPTSFVAPNNTRPINFPDFPIASCATSNTDRCAIYCKDFPLPGDIWEGGCPPGQGGGGDDFIIKNDSNLKGDVYDAIDDLSNINALEKLTLQKAIDKISKGEYNSLSKAEIELITKAIKEGSEHSKMLLAALNMVGYNTEPQSGSTNNTPDIKVNTPKQSSLLVSLYPNPSQGKLNIEYTLVEDNNISISITDINGKKLAEVITNNKHSRGTYNKTFDASQLSDGVYFISFKTNDETITKKFIKIGN